MRKHYALFFLLLLRVISSTAQSLDYYHLLLFPLTKKDNGSWQIGEGEYLNSFNRRGYNNQPNFFNDNELYLSAQLYGDTTQTDIVALNLREKSIDRVTATPLTAEYSPTLMPGGLRWSAIRVEEDGVQHLWSFPLDRSDNGRRELDRIPGVGYHCWLRDTLVALFIVGENGAPHKLVSTGLAGQQMQFIASNPGRSLAKTADGKLVFVQKVTEQTWFLKTWNPNANTHEIIVKMPAGTEDFALLADGTFLCGNGTQLWQYQPGKHIEWQPVVDLARYQVKKITRLSASKDGKLVVVVQ
jgi:hypothetical protein